MNKEDNLGSDGPPLHTKGKDQNPEE